MNKIQNTKANSTIRRFFSRMGGGGVKALGYKAVNISNEGGGTSSEDAEKMYEALFGQTPYIPKFEEEGVAMVPLYEVFTPNTDAEIPESPFYYKSSTPVTKATEMYFKDSTTLGIYFPMNADIYMVEMPVEVSGLDIAYYTPVPYDINLIDYTIPTIGNPTTVSGTLPNKSGITVLLSDSVLNTVELPIDIYTWNNSEHAFELNVGDGDFYILKQSGDNVIEWSYGSRVD